MSALDDLPADQRAVLELVLARGRNYDQIAALLGLDRAAVRQRALDAMDNLAPNAGVPPERRALVTDYLVGQLPSRVAEQVRERLADEPTEREWARALAAELTPLAAQALPVIPDGAEAAAASPPVTPVPAASEADTPTPVTPPSEETPGPAAPRRSSRTGGVILLVVSVLVVIGVVIVIATSGGSSKKTTTTTPPSTTPGTAASTSSSTTGAGSKILANVKLAPVSATSKAKGEAAAFSNSGQLFLAIVAVNLSPNSTATASRNYYGVWLSNSPTDSRFLGFAPIVTSNGQLRAATQLRSTDNRYKKLLLTLETKQSPKAPGTVVLSGAFNLK